MKERRGEEKRGGISLACLWSSFYWEIWVIISEPKHSWSVVLSFSSGQSSFPAFLIGAAGSWWRRSVPLLLVGGDLASWVTMDFLCWVRRGFWEKQGWREKNKWNDFGASVLRGYANRELDMVLRQWVPQKVKFFELSEVGNKCQTCHLRKLRIFSVISDELLSDEWSFFYPYSPLSLWDCAKLCNINHSLLSFLFNIRLYLTLLARVYPTVYYTKAFWVFTF